MMGGNPNWWSMHLNIPQHHHQYLVATPTSSSTWSQQLFTGEEESNSFDHGDDYSHINMNMLDFTYNKPPPPPPPPAVSYECNSSRISTNNNKNKKGRVSSQQQHLKVRKEKLGDRITALHQLVSPFGKTDTASVLLEAIGYIGFLHAQIQALSSSYLDNTNNPVFPEDSGQLLNGHGLKRKRAAISRVEDGEDSKNKRKDLKSRGLCLVPISCTQHVGTQNNHHAADYWASPFATGF